MEMSESDPIADRLESLASYVCSLDPTTVMFYCTTTIILFFLAFDKVMKGDGADGGSGAMHEVLVLDNSISFHFSFFLVMGVLFVVTINLLLDYINYRTKEAQEERKDLLLTMRASLIFSLFLPVFIVYVSRAAFQGEVVPLYMSSMCLGMAIRQYYTIDIMSQSETKVFSKNWARLAFGLLCSFLILYLYRDYRDTLYWLRATLIFGFIITFVAPVGWYCSKINFKNELSATACTREAIVLSVALAPLPWLIFIVYFYVKDNGNQAGYREMSRSTFTYYLNGLNFFQIFQSVGLIIGPERIARLLLIKMKCDVLQTAKKLQHTIQPSILLLKRTLSMLKEPQIMHATHANDSLKESYDNLAIACERVMSDIEDLKRDELFILSRTGGFRPRLSTVSEETESQNDHHHHHPDYYHVVDVKEQNNNNDDNNNNINNNDSNSNRIDDMIKTKSYNDCDVSHGETIEDNECLSSIRRGSQFSVISDISDPNCDNESNLKYERKDNKDNVSNSTNTYNDSDDNRNNDMKSPCETKTSMIERSESNHFTKHLHDDNTGNDDQNIVKKVHTLSYGDNKVHPCSSEIVSNVNTGYTIDTNENTTSANEHDGSPPGHSSTVSRTKIVDIFF